VRFVIATDDDTALVAEVERLLRERQHDVTRLAVGPWAKVALDAAQRVASGAADQAVVLCFTGTGVVMAANKVPGIRAALCVDAATAAGARRWNDANVLGLSLRLLSRTLLAEILEAWLGTVYSGTESESLAAIARAEVHAPAGPR
jgi:ribose 5-phosphate isomerase B